MANLDLFNYLLLAGLVTIQCNAKCSKVLGRYVADAEAKMIVNKHNELRGLISNGSIPNQPKAANLKKIKWDHALAKSAQNVSDSCEMKHFVKKDARWHAVGQNIYQYKSTNQIKSANWTAAIRAWFDENKWYKFPENSNSNTGHYTQIVWADTEYVGCGFTYYKEDNGVFKYKQLHVCNYGPAGNYIGQAPYKTR